MSTSGEPTLRIEMISQARYLAATRAMMNTLASRIGFDEFDCGQISLAVDEALCNVINHGYEKRTDGRIWISVWEIKDSTPGLRVVIEDRGRQVCPTTIKSRDLDEVRPGGLGVHLIKEIMDEVTYEQRQGGGMRLTLVKKSNKDSRSSSDCQTASRKDRPHYA